MLVSSLASTISGLISMFKLKILILFPSGLTIIRQTRKFNVTMWNLMLMLHGKLDEVRVQKGSIYPSGWFGSWLKGPPLSGAKSCS